MVKCNDVRSQPPCIIIKRDSDVFFPTKTKNVHVRYIKTTINTKLSQ